STGIDCVTSGPSEFNCRVRAFKSAAPWCFDSVPVAIGADNHALCRTHPELVFDERHGDAHLRLPLTVEKADLRHRDMKKGTRLSKSKFSHTPPLSTTKEELHRESRLTDSAMLLRGPGEYLFLTPKPKMNISSPFTDSLASHHDSHR